MGWASFEVREAQTKICFDEWLRNMDGSKWAARVLLYLYIKSVDTQWRKRTRMLRTNYMIPASKIETPKAIKRKVRNLRQLTGKKG